MTVKTENSEEQKSPTSSSLLLTKGLRLLQHVANQGESGVREIARQMSFSPTVAHRLVTSLMKEGFLERNDETGRYRVGAQAFAVGRAFLKSARIESVAPPIMREIVEEGEFNAFLSVMRGAQIVYISAMQDNGPIRWPSWIGGNWWRSTHPDASCTSPKIHASKGSCALITSATVSESGSNFELRGEDALSILSIGREVRFIGCRKIELHQKAFDAVSLPDWPRNCV